MKKKCTLHQWWNNDKGHCVCVCVCVCVKNTMYLKKIIFRILLHVVWKWKLFSMYIRWFNDYVWRVIEETKTFLANFKEKKETCKTQNVYILLAFLLITIILLIAVSINCYLIKYKSKRKHLLPFYITNNELKEIMHW